MKKTKQLFLYGIALFGIAICDLILLFMGIRAGDFAMITHEDALVQAVTNATVTIVFVCSIISMVVGGYLGVKGIWESKNPSGGGFHIFLARVVGILNLILTVFMGLALLNSTDLSNDIQSFIICAGDMILMFCYANAAKAVRNGEE